jgi:hypothetical protein
MLDLIKSEIEAELYRNKVSSAAVERRQYADGTELLELWVDGELFAQFEQLSPAVTRLSDHTVSGGRYVNLIGPVSLAREVNRLVSGF